jgi:hypothetical protein
MKCRNSSGGAEAPPFLGLFQNPVTTGFERSSNLSGPRKSFDVRQAFGFDMPRTPGLARAERRSGIRARPPIKHFS